MYKPPFHVLTNTYNIYTRSNDILIVSLRNEPCQYFLGILDFLYGFRQKCCILLLHGHTERLLMKCSFYHKGKNKKYHIGFSHLTAVFFSLSLFLSNCFIACAEPSEAEERLEMQRAMEIQSNLVDNWPTGPVVGAESAILMEAETGTILYAKNIHQRQYPASTTKILTTLIATEQCTMDEMVTFSHEAVFDTPRDSNHIAIDEGEALTLEQCLNAILIRSANEVSFAVAEHIAGESWHNFAEIMNARAAELGCLNSNFVNPNGLPDENHYTTAYDLAMIGKAFFANEILCQITMTKRLEIQPSDTQPDLILENNSMELIPGRKYAYDYLVGCKTGYTNAARSSLVSCAERDGMKLICVVMRDEAPYQYEDTISLFEYGFSNFEKVNVAQTETKYDIDNTGLFYGGNDIFGSSAPILSLNRDDYIIMPRTATFDDIDSTISYDTAGTNQAAVITYTYHGVDIGIVRLNFNINQNQAQIFDTDLTTDGSESTNVKKSNTPVIYINILRVLSVIGIVAAILVVVILIRLFLKNYQFSIRSNHLTRGKGSRRPKTKVKRKKRYRDYDF